MQTASDQDSSLPGKINNSSLKMGLSKESLKNARAWYFYDMGSSAYALSVGTLYFPLYFNEFAAHGKATSSHFAVSVLLSTLLVGIIAPLLGAFADHKLKRNVVFIITGWISVIGTALLPLTADVPIWAAIIAYVVVNVTFLLATNMYDSYISLFGALDKNYARRSGLGWALGYLGGILCLGVTLSLLGFRVPATKSDYWIVFIVCAVMYGGFSAYVFSKLPMERELPPRDLGILASVLSTLRRWRERRLFFAYLIGSILIVDGMTTVLYFMSIYSSEKLKFSVAQITLVFAIVQGVAIPSTWLFALAVHYVREVILIILTCLGWMILTVFFALGPSYWGMLLLSVGGGLVVGATPSLLRAMLGQLVPPESRAELFGFAALASRVGAILGPLIYLVTLRSLGITAAMFSSVPAFIIGSIIFGVIAKKLPTDRSV